MTKTPYFELKDKHNEFCITTVNKRLANVIQKEIDDLITLLILTNKYFHIRINQYGDIQSYKFTVCLEMFGNRLYDIDFNCNENNNCEYLTFWCHVGDLFFKQIELNKKTNLKEIREVFMKLKMLP